MILALLSAEFWVFLTKRLPQQTAVAWCMNPWCVMGERCCMLLNRWWSVWGQLQLTEGKKENSSSVLAESKYQTNYTDLLHYHWIMIIPFIHHSIRPDDFLHTLNIFQEAFRVSDHVFLLSYSDYSALFSEIVYTLTKEMQRTSGWKTVFKLFSKRRAEENVLDVPFILHIALSAYVTIYWT